MTPSPHPFAMPPSLPDDEVMDGAQPDPQDAAEENSGMRREIGEVSDARRALCAQIQAKVKAAKTYHARSFRQMRDDLEFLGGDQWNKGRYCDDYVANITQRHVSQRVAALYAKNPVVVCSRRKMLDFKLWDESSAALINIQTAMQKQATEAGASQQLGAPPAPMDPGIMAVIQDVMTGTQRRKLFDKVARTLEIVYKHALSEQHPPFKTQMKQLVRRALGTSVGYVKVGYQRAMEKRPEDVEKITDISQRIAQIQARLADVQDAELDQCHADFAQLQFEMEDLKNRPEIVVSEGLVFDFPKSTSIIVDPRATQLNGFLGAQWVAQEYMLTAEDVKEIYSIDLGKDFKPYIEAADATTAPWRSEEQSKKGLVCVWEIYSKTDGMCYFVADGYADFLKEPSAPSVELTRFWPIFSLTFNEVEHDKALYPPSDVTLARPMQKEYNRSRQMLREHRLANRPKTAVGKGQLDDEDKAKLQSHPANALLELNMLSNGARVSDVLQVFSGPPIDPAMYDNQHVFDDFQRVLGSSEANMGGTSGATATENSIAESSRTAGLASNIDDLDDLLNELSRCGGQVLLKELSAEEVTRIAGPGATWPELTRDEVARELTLEIEAGSSGRPNKSAEIANFERLAPFLLQIPGIPPEWLAKQAIRRLDDRLDMADAFIEGAQSIIAMNGAKQVSTGDPATDPAQQGAQGAQGAQAPQAPQGPSPAQQDTGAPDPGQQA